MLRFLMLLFLLLNLFDGVAQTNQVRIAEIDKMYKEINQLLLDSSAICREAVKIEMDGFSPDSEQMSFEQKAEFCVLKGEFETYSGFFTGYEWNVSSKFYFKNDQPILVLITGDAERSSYNSEAYYDEYGKIMILINSEYNLSVSNAVEPEIITDGELLKQAEEEINEVLKEIKSILGE